MENKKPEQFCVGDILVYSKRGVYRVVAIGIPAFLKEKDKRYYTLRRLVDSSSNETLYVPLDAKVSMRPLISKDQAKEYLRKIPEIKVSTFKGRLHTHISDHYKELLSSNDVLGYLHLIKEIYLKKQSLQKDQKLWAVDTQYLKVAETLVYEEFSYVLNISPVDIKETICQLVRRSLKES